MTEAKFVLEFKDPGLQALQLARALPFTVTLDLPEGDDPNAKPDKKRGEMKKGLKDDYEAALAQAKADIYVGEDEPNNEPAFATALVAPPAEEEAPSGGKGAK